MCGCKTPNLLMANRACEDNCYPKIITKNIWNNYIRNGKIGIVWKVKSTGEIRKLKKWRST